jgi:hypothetical protein
VKTSLEMSLVLIRAGRELDSRGTRCLRQPRPGTDRRVDVSSRRSGPSTHLKQPRRERWLAAHRAPEGRRKRGKRIARPAVLDP